MKKRIISLLFVIVLLILPACQARHTPSAPTQTIIPPITQTTSPISQTAPEPSLHVKQTQMIAADFFGCFYNDMYFYNKAQYHLDGSTLYKQDLSNPEDQGQPVWDGDGKDPFLEEPVIRLVLVDEKATQENKGIPILIIAQNGHIFSFDTATNRIKTIVDVPGGMVSSLYLYDNYLYYTVLFENDMQFPLYKVSKHGGVSIKMEAEAGAITLLGVYKNQLYFFHNSLTEGNVYQSNSNMINPKLLLETAGSQYMKPFIQGEYLYYASVPEKITVNKNTLDAVNICRRPLSNFSDEAEEVLLERVMEATHAGNKLFYFSAGDEQILWQEGTAQNYRTVLRVLDLATNESQTVYDHSTDELQYHTLINVSENYIRYTISQNTQDLSSQAVFIINLKTKQTTSFS